MIELFVIGTFWFWVMTALMLIFIAAFAENEKGGAATVCLLIYLGVLQWCSGANILGYIVHNPIQIVAAVAVYFVIGTAWAVCKWWFYVKGRSQELTERLRDFCAERKLPFKKPVSPEVWAKFKVSLGYSDGKLKIKPQIQDHKERFISWMSFWPVSVLYTLLNDVVRNLCRHIYTALAEKLQDISDRIYGGLIPEEVAGEGESK